MALLCAVDFVLLRPGVLLFLAVLLGTLAVAGAIVAVGSREVDLSARAREQEERVLYRERGRRWPLPVYMGAVGVAFGALWLSGDRDRAYGLLGAAGVLLVFAVGPLAVGAWLYSKVLLTPTELRVGQDRVPLADIDRKALERAISGEGGSAAPGWGREDPRLVGGAWAPSLGKRHLLLVLTGDDRPRTVPTRHPDRLRRALAGAVDAAPGSAG